MQLCQNRRLPSIAQFERLPWVRERPETGLLETGGRELNSVAVAHFSTHRGLVDWKLDNNERQ